MSSSYAMDTSEDSELAQALAMSLQSNNDGVTDQPEAAIAKVELQPTTADCEENGQCMSDNEELSRAIIMSLRPESDHCGVGLTDKAKALELAHSICCEYNSMQAQSIGLLHTAILLLKMLDTPGRDAEHCLSEILLARFFHLRWDVDLTDAHNLIYKFEANERENSEEISQIILATDLFLQFKKSVDSSRINDAIHLYQAVLFDPHALTKSERYDAYLGLSDSLYIRSYLSASIDDITTSITLLQKALLLTEISDHRRFNCSLCISARLYTLYISTSKFNILMKARSFFRPAEDAVANAAFVEGEKHRLSGSYESAISHFHHSLSLRPKPHYRRVMTLHRLFLSLSERPSDLPEYIKCGQEILQLIPAPHPFRRYIIHSLGISHATQGLSNKDIKILEKATVYLRESLYLETDDKRRVDFLSALGLTLIACMNVSSESKDCYVELRELVSMLQTLRSHSTIPTCDFGEELVDALLVRFNRRHETEDLDDAIFILRDGLKDSHSDRRLSQLHQLERCLQCRISQSSLQSQHSDTEEMIIINQEKLKLIEPNDHVARSNANRAMAVYSTTLGFKSQLLDCKRTISLLREEAHLVEKDSSQRGLVLRFLSVALLRSYEDSCNPDDLNESIALLRESDSLGFDSEGLLGSTLIRRYMEFKDKDPKDLEEGLKLLNHRVAVAKEAEFEWVADAMLELYMASGCQSTKHLEDAISIWREIMHDAANFDLKTLWRTVWEWTRQAHLHHHSSTLEAYTMAIELLPRLTTADKDVDARHKDLMFKFPGLAGDSASFALGSGCPDMAVEFLETARAVFWSQYINLRTPLQELEVVSPELAGQLAQISTDLTKSSFHKKATHLHLFAAPWSQTMIDKEKEDARGRRLKECWEATLNRVRSTVLGFENFLRPKKFHQLQQAALRGPVILLTGSEVDDMCHALVITQADLQHFTLPFSYKIARGLATIFRGAFFSGSQKTRSMDLSLPEYFFDQCGLDRDTRLKLKSAGLDTNTAMLDWNQLFCVYLSILWKNIASPIIHTLQLTKSETPSRIWWCATGPFAFIPVHAAGIYDLPWEKHWVAKDDLDCLSNYAVSSYTPTLEALLVPPPANNGSFKMLTIIQTEQSSYSKLPSTRTELEKIKSRVASESLTILGDKPSPCFPNPPKATVENVVRNLPFASIVHFACHGTQDLDKPLESSLILSDEVKLTIPTIMNTRMPNAELAFLCACETAKGVPGSEDEVLHVAATMLFAGFRGAVGTMWSIYDVDGPIVADAFYEYLFRNGRDSTPDTTEAAYALHLAVKKLRSNPDVSFLRWVPFIHMGI